MSGHSEVYTSEEEVISTHIAFSRPFLSVPSVSINIKTTDPSNRFINAGNITRDGFDVFAKGAPTSDGKFYICWSAVGN